MKTKYDTSDEFGKIAVMSQYAQKEETPLCARRLLSPPNWKKLSNPPGWNWDEFDYNYPADPPRKVLKPWTFETFPKDSNLWIRDHVRGMARVTYIGLTGFTANEVGVTFQGAMKTCEYSFDNGLTWHPCGIETEEL